MQVDSTEYTEATKTDKMLERLSGQSPRGLFFGVRYHPTFSKLENQITKSRQYFITKQHTCKTILIHHKKISQKGNVLGAQYVSAGCAIRLSLARVAQACLGLGYLSCRYF